MATNLGPETDTPEPAVSLWRWFWLIALAVVVLTLLAMAAIANRISEEHVAPGPDWPQCCDHWRTKRVSTSKHLIY